MVGVAGSGKTWLLRMLEGELRRQGRPVFFVPLYGVRRAGEVGGRALEAIDALGLRGSTTANRVLQSSAGAPRTSDVVDILQDVGANLERPVLILDGLDEAADTAGTASTVAELSRALTDWQIVVSSRPGREDSRLEHFDVVEVGALSFDEAVALVREAFPESTDQQISEAFAASGGLPFVLRMVASLGFPDILLDSLQQYEPANFEKFALNAISATPEQAKVEALLERLALMGRGEPVGDLAAWSGLTGEAVLRLADNSLISITEDGVALIHDFVGSILIGRRLREFPVHLADLKFGDEDAERDDLLDESFVPRQNFASILSQRRSIVIGDRGSGKSAIFRKLSKGEDGVEIFPVVNASDMLQRIAGAAVRDADTLRAAWVVVVSAVLAGALPESAPKTLLRDAAELRAAVGLPTRPAGRVVKALRAAVRPFGGTTLSFAVGPVNLEAQLPDGGRSSSATVDVEAFLQELSNLLKGAGRRAVVLIDRIDELFKYDRAKQEAVVQGLLQAESRVSLLDGITVVIFLRTDLFELYDIQEKNKLVSRRLVLEWSEEDWLQVLVRRALANQALGWVADRLRLPAGGFETQPALGVLFPGEVESRPVDRWLVDSVRNGNGDVSPRLTVLLLYLARDYSARQSVNVDALPLFTADAVARAMTEVSELSFSEVVNDFKVASSFVLNCRAGKRTTFTLAEVENLFDLDEGPASEQVRLLERLGFLERVVVDTNAGAQSQFRIPELYTRCWEHG
jgi:hypothetical protein